jgi:hypothetical protein
MDFGRANSEVINLQTGKKVSKGKKKRKKIPGDGKKLNAEAFKEDEKEELVCRICLCDDNEEDNPLFAPCKCSGSMKLIH